MPSQPYHYRSQGDTQATFEPLLQRSAALHTLRKMMVFGTSFKVEDTDAQLKRLALVDSRGKSVHDQQNEEPLSCEEIAIMLDYMQKLTGSASSAEASARRVNALSVRGLLSDENFERMGTPEYLDKAINYKRWAVLLTPDGNSGKPNSLDSLGRSYLRRFERLGEMSDVDKAIACQTRAMELEPAGDAGRLEVLNNLGLSYQSRFRRLGELSDLDKAISCHTQALDTVPASDASKLALFSNLGNCYQVRFEWLGELSDMSKALACHTQAVELTPEGHPEKAGLFRNLGNSYLGRYGRHGEEGDVDEAIVCYTRAVELTPDGHGGKPAGLSQLGSAYQSRFERLGQVLDIDKAIGYHARAVKLAPDKHADKPGFLTNLGAAYHERYGRFRELSDIDQSIACHTQAVELTPEGHPSKPDLLNNLGNSHQGRFEKLGEIVDVDKAIAYKSRAVDLTPEGHTHLSGQLSNLGNSYMRRFYRFGKIEDVDEAIVCQTRAVDLTPQGYPNKALFLSNLGNSYQYRFDRFGDIEDLDKAIGCHTQAVDLTPDSHSDKPGWLLNLGGSHYCRFTRLGEHSNGAAAHASFQLAAQLPAIKPVTQFYAARRWAKCSSQLGVSPQLAYHTAMRLVPQLVWLGATIEQRYDLLIEIGDVATSGAAWAISAESYDLAVEWLEEGRSIVWNQILQLRTTFDELSTVDPALAKRLQQTASELEHAGSRPTATSTSTNGAPDLEQDAQHHRRLAVEWEQLLTQARSIDGFKNFMCPRKVNELRLAAKNGPVVLINVHSSRCDALILQQNIDGTAHVPLPNFSEDIAASAHAQLVSLLGRQGARSRGFKSSPFRIELRRILATLWSDVVEPILDCLGYTQRKLTNKLPHITWCTIGALSFLPLHAAGCYDGLQPNAPDLIVSSYTPTLGALLSSATQVSSQHSGLLAVGQQFSSKYGDLPSTVEELAAISTQAKAFGCQTLEGSNATIDAVIDGMKKNSWLHLACHAKQHPENPAHSAFHLHDGDLTLQTITRCSFKNKGLAFLSACQTATGDEKRPDESIHLAAGMMMAGYPSVIATMWSIYDIDGPEVAGQVYAELLKDGRMECAGAARALHKAVAGLREKVGEDSFMRWVPFVHIGV